MNRNGRGGTSRRDWRRDQPEPPAQRINSFMLEDPMYEYMEEKRRREKQDRIDQLKALLESSTDSDSSSENVDEHKKSKKKKKHKHKKNRKRTYSSSDIDGEQTKAKKAKKKDSKKTSDIEWVEAFPDSPEKVHHAQDKHKKEEVVKDSKIKRHSKSNSKTHSRHKKERKKKKKTKDLK